MSQYRYQAHPLLVQEGILKRRTHMLSYLAVIFLVASIVCWWFS
jgi:hypothetical protein